MKYAILNAGQITAHGTAAELWPNTSFPGGVPTAGFLAELGAHPVISALPYDPDTQKVVPVAPYMLDGTVYDVMVAALTLDEIDAALTAKRASMNCTPRQIRQAMTRTPFGTGTLREAVEAAVAAGDQDLRDWWEFTTTFERNHPQVLAMTAALGKTEAELDALFALAATL